MAYGHDIRAGCPRARGPAEDHVANLHDVVQARVDQRAALRACPFPDQHLVAGDPGGLAERAFAYENRPVPRGGLGHGAGHPPVPEGDGDGVAHGELAVCGAKSRSAGGGVCVPPGRGKLAVWIHACLLSGVGVPGVSGHRTMILPYGTVVYGGADLGGIASGPGIAESGQGSVSHQLAGGRGRLLVGGA